MVARVGWRRQRGGPGPGESGMRRPHSRMTGLFSGWAGRKPVPREDRRSRKAAGTPRWRDLSFGPWPSSPSTSPPSSVFSPWSSASPSYASRGRQDAADYFLAGRNLPWWLIGFSLIASNISTEHFVGMAGRGYELGLAIASYEWMAAVTLVLVGFFFLPRFLQAGIYTIPEYLEFRYDVRTRTLMAAFIMAAYVFVALATVLYSGALALESIFGIDGGMAVLYVVFW